MWDSTVNYCSLSMASFVAFLYAYVCSHAASLQFGAKTTLGSGWTGSYCSYWQSFTLATVAVSVSLIVVDAS